VVQRTKAQTPNPSQPEIVLISTAPRELLRFAGRVLSKPVVVDVWRPRWWERAELWFWSTVLLYLGTGRMKE
jgi:hypothetical protein